MTSTYRVSRAFSQKSFSFGDFFTFLVPALYFFRVEVGGVLFGTDLMLFAAFPIVLVRTVGRIKKKEVFCFVLLGLAWLLSQILTDIVRNTLPEDYVRGWSKILLTLTHFIVIWYLIRGSIRRFFLYGMGLAVGGLLTWFIAPSRYAASDPWKFGLALPISLLILLLMSSQPRKAIILAALLALAVVDLFANFRSLGLISFLTAVYSYFQIYAQSPRRRFGTLRKVAIGSALIIGVSGFVELYIHSAQQGWLGEQAQSKYRDQSGEAGLLLGGRSEILASAPAIADSPVLGYGSWAKDSRYGTILIERRAELGYKNLPLEDDLIPTHSHLFGAWVEAGMAGAVFWIFVLILTIGALSRISGLEPLSPVFIFIGILLCWDILFSPYGAERRFVTTYFIAGMMLLRDITIQQTRFLKRPKDAPNFNRHNLIQPSRVS